MVDMCIKYSMVVLIYKFIFEDWGECLVGGLWDDIFFFNN